MDSADRLPQTGAAGAALKRKLADKLVEHKACIRTHRQDMAEVRHWRWKVET
jgi:xylulose-5-phosphate/fructose-6-phosphate phosphoketolase